MNDKIVRYSLKGAASTVYSTYASKIKEYCEANGIDFSMKNTDNNLRETLCKSRQQTLSFCPIEFYIELLDLFKDASTIESRCSCSIGCNLSMGSHIGTFDRNNPHLYLAVTFFFVINKEVVMKWKLIPNIKDGKKVINQGIVIKDGGISIFSYKRITEMAWERFVGNYDHVVMAPGTLFIHSIITRLNFGKFDTNHVDYTKDRKEILEHITQFNIRYGTNMYLSDDGAVMNPPTNLKKLCEQSAKDGVNYPYITSMIKKIGD